MPDGDVGRAGGDGGEAKWTNEPVRWDSRRRIAVTAGDGDLNDREDREHVLDRESMMPEMSMEESEFSPAHIVHKLILSGRADIAHPGGGPSSSMQIE